MLLLYCGKLTVNCNEQRGGHCQTFYFVIFSLQQTTSRTGHRVKSTGSFFVLATNMLNVRNNQSDFFIDNNNCNYVVVLIQMGTG